MKDLLKFAAILLVMAGVAYGLFRFTQSVDKRQLQESEQAEKQGR